jgi:hypothetical protein
VTRHPGTGANMSTMSRDSTTALGEEDAYQTPAVDAISPAFLLDLPVKTTAPERIRAPTGGGA